MVRVKIEKNETFSCFRKPKLVISNYLKQDLCSKMAVFEKFLGALGPFPKKNRKLVQIS